MTRPLLQLALSLTLCASLAAGTKASTGIIYWSCGPADGPAFVLEIDGAKSSAKTVIMVNQAMPDMTAGKPVTFKISNRLGHVMAEQCGSASCGPTTSGGLTLEKADDGFVTGSYSLTTPGDKTISARFKVRRVERKMVCG